MANIRKYHTTAFDDANSVRLISDILEKHHLIKTSFLEQDKTPNTDGYFTVLSEDGTPIKVFIVQIKSTHSLPLITKGVNTGKYIYKAELPFFYYIYSGVDSNPAIFFVSNLETKQVFYKYLSDEYLNTLPFGNKNYVTVKFVDSEQVVDDKTFYEEMLVIIADFARFRNIRKKAGLNSVHETNLPENDSTQTKRSLRDYILPYLDLLKIIFSVLLFGFLMHKLLDIILQLIFSSIAGTLEIEPLLLDCSPMIIIYLTLFVIICFICIYKGKRSIYLIPELFSFMRIKRLSDVDFAESLSIGDIIWDNYKICRITEKKGELHHIIAFSLNEKQLVSIYPVENMGFKQLLPSVYSIKRPSIYPQLYSYKILNTSSLFAIEQHHTGITLEEFVQSHTDENKVYFILFEMLNALISSLSLISDKSYTAWQRFLPRNMIITSSNELFISGYESIGVFVSRRDFFSCSIKDIVSTCLFFLTQGSYTPNNNYLSAEKLNELIIDNSINEIWASLLEKIISLDYKDALQGVEYIKGKIDADSIIRDI